MDDLSALQLVFSDHLAPHSLVKVRTETGKTKAPKPEYKSRQNMSVLLKVSAVSYSCPHVCQVQQDECQTADTNEWQTVTQKKMKCTEKSKEITEFLNMKTENFPKILVYEVLTFHIMLCAQKRAKIMAQGNITIQSVIHWCPIEIFSSLVCSPFFMMLLHKCESLSGAMQ